MTDDKEGFKDKNVDRIKKATDELTKASHKLAEEVYKQSAGKQAGGAQPGPEQGLEGQEGGSLAEAWRLAQALKQP